jgi:predicted metal-binding protein
MIDPAEVLLDHAYQLGVTDAQLIPAAAVTVEARLAQMCREPACPAYGRSINCPPHVMKPARFRRLLQEFNHTLVFKFDTATAILQSDARLSVARRVHETAAQLERLALALSYRRARGLAASSCKRIFCDDYEVCLALTAGGECRHPERARPSLAGLGVDFSALAAILGWPLHPITRDTDPGAVPTGFMAGMVLLAR